jgi:mono/diheme cytochrome c family protein
VFYRFLRPPCLAGLTLSFLAFNGSAHSQSGDVSRGRDLANKHCARCHVLSEDKGRERDGRYVPSLAEVANTPHYSLIRLRRIIAVPPHREMSKAPLNTSEINDVAHYIQLLRKKKR